MSQDPTRSPTSESRARRASAVAKLKRAASLPRMKDGRRPPMHTEAQSEGEKASTDSGSGTPEISGTTPEPLAPQATYDEPPAPALVPEPEPEPTPTQTPVTETMQESGMGDVEGEAEEGPATPSDRPRSRNRKRNRSRSRGRGSKEFRKAKSPTPSQMLAGDSSQDEEMPPPPPQPLPPLGMPMLISPIPQTLDARTRFLRTPTPDPSLFPMAQTQSPTPMLPSLELLQRGMLFRSNSAGAGRRLAMAKLTGGTETYDPTPSPAPPGTMPKLSRSQTVSGGERVAARQFMLTAIGQRTRRGDNEAEQPSAAEELSAPSPSPSPSPSAKRRRRRSRQAQRISQQQQAAAMAAAGHQTTSDSEFMSTTPNTPVQPPTPLQPDLDRLQDLRARSTTPSFMTSPLMRTLSREQQRPETPPTTQQQDRFTTPKKRRGSILIEDDYEAQEQTLPPMPTRPPPGFRVPFSSDAPSQISVESGAPGSIGVPVFLSSQRSLAKPDEFPSSPFATPLRERALLQDEHDEDEEEKVLYNNSYPSYEDREISWVADPVPEVHDEDEEEPSEGEDADADGYEDDAQAQSEVASTSNRDQEESSRPSSDHGLGSETSHDLLTSFPNPPSPASNRALSHVRVSSGSSMSPSAGATRPSVVSPLDEVLSRRQSGFHDTERTLSNDSSLSKREGGSTSTWDKIKNSLSRSNSSSGRRSRSNSVLNRERREHTDSSVSRESGASITGPVGLMQSPSASGSYQSLVPHLPGHASPMPPPSGDLSHYNDAKLFPFPGMKMLEEQRRAKEGFSASASTPDFSGMGGKTDDEHSPRSPILQGFFTGSGRERKLSHQASDTRLLAKYNGAAPPMSAAPSSSSHDYPQSPPTPSGSSKLPTNLPAVRQWISKNLKKKASSPQMGHSISTASISLPIIAPPMHSKKPSLSELLQLPKEDSPGSEWSDVGGPVLPVQTPPQQARALEVRDGSASNSDQTDTEKTPRAKKVAPVLETDESSTTSYEAPRPSPPEHPATVTPDPTSSLGPGSSLSDYPAQSTSTSSSNSSGSSSSAYMPSVKSQGPVILEKLEESLSRGSRGPMWAGVLEEPTRKLLLSSPVLQVVDSNTVKDRFLFLFTDILVIAKPVIQDSDNMLEPTWALIAPDKKFIVKSVVRLRDLRFNDERSDMQSKGLSATAVPRSPAMRTFVHQFARDPDMAISTLLTKAGTTGDAVAVGQLLFRTLELDRVRLGEYLAQRTSKVVLKTFVDTFGFAGMRIDKALRAFLMSIHAPTRSALDTLLDAFASRWYVANAGIVAYDRDLAVRFVRAIVQLNELVHGGVATEPGPTGYMLNQISSRDFISAFRRFDPRYLVADDLLDDVYRDICSERLAMARDPSSGGLPDIPVTIKRPVPMRLTYKIQSEPIIFRIPQPDNQFSIHLSGQGLTFDPEILYFARSPEASFRVTGTALGPTTLVLERRGSNALRYTGLPLSCGMRVERAFMRNTFQVAFRDRGGAKRRYMFSVDDHLLRHQWATYLPRQIRTCAGDSEAVIPRGAFHRAAENVALAVLQETLIGSGKAPQTASTPATHARSKSRSKVYHRHGAGRNELELGAEESDESSGREGRLWSGRELETLCLQNSSVTLVLSYLQVGALESKPVPL
ncbi:uncharacterized protein SCHCODRAFT_02634603 [Schizophyllum commune H4-8]|nr:uncharacterized protein SCHCODRAFT_02634603 [Schizophyllum commune H4-8]KAI5889464.1 hypothetical protein SCHCODRAFT_02634603 [Schizophyllum commune H4-8]